MLVNPRIGSHVQVWYGEQWRRDLMPLHGRIGIAVIVFKRTRLNKGPPPSPRNHGVRIDNDVYVVPCGNLRKVSDG